jgi:group I intron endonuclease
MTEEIKALPGVYILTNKTNGKVYVGETMNVRKRFNRYENISRKSNRPIENSIRKYGLDGFHIEIDYLPDFKKIDLLDLEEQLIIKFKSLITENGYNICSRGTDRTGMKHSEQSKQMIAKSMLGKNHSDETRKKIANNSTLKHSVSKFSLDNNLLETYETTKGAATKNNVCQSNITLCCQCKRKTAGGFIWKYAI